MYHLIDSSSIHIIVMPCLGAYFYLSYNSPAFCIGELISIQTLCRSIVYVRPFTDALAYVSFTRSMR